MKTIAALFAGGIIVAIGLCLLEVPRDLNFFQFMAGWLLIVGGVDLARWKAKK